MLIFIIKLLSFINIFTKIMKIFVFHKLSVYQCILIQLEKLVIN